MMRWLVLGALVWACPAAAQSLTRSQQAVCEEAANVQDSDPFSLRDNVVTGVGAAADMAASALVHTFPAFAVVPVLAIAIDNVIAGHRSVKLPQGITINGQQALMVLGAFVLVYALVVPAMDAVILMAVRSASKGSLPPWRHAVAMLVASYLSFPVALAGAFGLVGMAGALVTPNVPNALGPLGPAPPLIQDSLQLVLFALTLEGVFVVVRPLGLALFERAGNAYFPRNLPETEQVIASPSTGGKT